MEYRTVRGPGEETFTERRSRFIGHAQPVSSESEALSFIAALQKRYWDANHNVYAYILREGGQRRYSDDGEPQGTAGIPVLEVLQKESLTDVCVVVTRYFGGILLGGGGLVRAYTQGAKCAVDAAGIRRMAACATLEIVCDYGLYGKVSYLAPQCGAVILDSDFGADVRLTLRIEASLRAPFEKELREQTSGLVVPRLTGEGFAELEA